MHHWVPSRCTDESNCVWEHKRSQYMSNSPFLSSSRTGDECEWHNSIDKILLVKTHCRKNYLGSPLLIFLFVPSVTLNLWIECSLHRLHCSPLHRRITKSHFQSSVHPQWTWHWQYPSIGLHLQDIIKSKHLARGSSRGSDWSNPLNWTHKYHVTILQM